MWSKSSERTYSRLTLDNGVLYATTTQGEIVALAAGSGEELWSYRSGDASTYLSIAGHNLYLGSLAGGKSGRILTALDLTGRGVLWSRKMGAEDVGPLGNGTFYLAISTVTICPLP